MTALPFDVVDDDERQPRKQDRYDALFEALIAGKTVAFTWDKPNDVGGMRAVWSVRHQGIPLHIRRNGDGLPVRYVAWADILVEPLR